MTRLISAPAARALLIQGACAPLTYCLLFLLSLLHFPLTYMSAALLQGALAALLTWKFGLAPWWRLIQFCFPVAILAASALHLPSWLFLLLFLLLLGLYWSTFRTQVPYYPSTPAVRQALLELLPAPQAGRRVRLIDIGSGLGGLVMHLARARPDADCIGIELAPFPWLYSWLRSWLRSLPKPGQGGNRARFLLGDYEKLDFAQFDMVFAYLSPAAMDALWRKASAEMLPGSMLLSFEFPIPGQEPDQTILTTEGGTALYVWYF